MASLSLEHIDKTYPMVFKAVKDFNLDIADKEFIIFDNVRLRKINNTSYGCRSGRYFRRHTKIDGKVMNDVEPKDRDIAMVFPELRSIRIRLF